MSDEELLQLANDCLSVARHFGDRQNSPSTLTPREASKIVNACLGAGNVLQQIVRDRQSTDFTTSDEVPSCPSSPSPQT